MAIDPSAPKRSEKETPDRAISGEQQPEDRRVDYALRPRSLDEMIGQERLRDKMRILVDAARGRGESLDHVLFYGPPGLGKCIVANSLILTSEGLIPFQNLLPVGLEANTVSPLQVQVRGIKGIESTSHVYANGVSATMRVWTRSGFEIEGTPNHPVLVATEEGPRWKELRTLSSDDWVAVARGTDIWGQPATVKWQPNASTDRRSRVEARIGHYHAELTTALARPPAITELRHTYARGVSDTPTPELTAKRLGLPLSDGRTIPLAEQPWTLVSEPTHTDMRSITLDADIGYFLGVLVGDGHFEQGGSSCIITCGDDELLAELQQIIRNYFGKTIEVKQHGERTARLRFSQSIGAAMIAFGAKPVHAADKVVPSAVLQGPRAAAIGFLQGLFDADGCAWPDGCVEFGTRSEVLVREVHLLLANLGIIAHRTEKQKVDSRFWSLFIGGADALRFHEIVGFRLTRKRLRGQALQTRRRGWSRSDLVPGINRALRVLLDKSRPHPRAIHKTFDHIKRNDRIPTRQRVQHYLSILPDWVQAEPEFTTIAALTNPHIYWDRVVTVTESVAETFDFVVPGTHSFVANGIFNHNTTLSHILAGEMAGNMKPTAGPAIEKAGDLAAILTNLRKGDILFIDEIHRLGRAVEEILYPAMEDFVLDITVGSGPSARSIRLKLPRFTIIGATTRLALITSPLRARFGVVERFDFYSQEALQEIITRAAALLQMPIDEIGAREIARRSRGTPRVALRLLRRVRDYAQVRADGIIDQQVADEALAIHEIDHLGLDDLDRRVLDAIIHKFSGGPVGLETLAASISEEADTIMDVVEPYLLQLGFLDRTPRGRTATRAAYAHMSAVYPEVPSQSGLFG